MCNSPVSTVIFAKSETALLSSLRCPKGSTALIDGYSDHWYKAVQVILRVQWGQGEFLGAREGDPGGPMGAMGMSGASYGAIGLV